MPFTQKQLDDLAQRYTEAWNSKVPAQVENMHVPSSSIVINRGAPSAGYAGLTEMAAGFHSDVPDLHLTCDGFGVQAPTLYICGPSQATMQEQASHCV